MEKQTKMSSFGVSENMFKEFKVVFYVIANQ